MIIEEVKKELTGHIIPFWNKLEFKPFSNFLVVVCLIKLGISFDKVEDSVHGLISMQAILRKSVI